MRANKILHCDALTGLAGLATGSIPLVVTSPPWGRVREYGGHVFDFEPIAAEIGRVLVEGGVVCWHHQDQIEEGSESLERCRQLLHFREVLRLRIHQTLTIVCHSYRPSPRRFYRTVSQVYVISKGTPSVVNRPKIVRNSCAGMPSKLNFRYPDGTFERRPRTTTAGLGYAGDLWRFDDDDVWEYDVGWGRSCEDRRAIQGRHGAIMPVRLACDLVRSYSRPGDVVLDVCGGTGTTGVAALTCGRRFLLFEPWGDAVGHARRRLDHTFRRLCGPAVPDLVPVAR